ncbi:MAG: DUF4263 domain-containing protein [Nitrospinota bacterium]|nr:DUF4263 domain-containing protein [Nitrospinota bacterium]
MNDIIKTKSIGKWIAEVEEDFILLQEPMSRLVFHAQIHKEGIRGKIIRQRREKKDDEWIPDEAIDIRSLEKKVAINIELRTEAVTKLYSAISKLANILRESGVQYGEHEYAVVDPKRVIITDDNKAAYIRKIIEAGYSEDVWHELAEANPPLATKLSYAKIHSERLKCINDFEQRIGEDQDESYWQGFFKENTWIFGYGLRYQFLSLVTDQPTFSGPGYDGSNMQRGDYLMVSEAEKKFTVLVEIKKPQTPLTLRNEYRAGTWKLGQELLWAVSQVQTNCNSWFRDGSRADIARDDLEQNEIYTHQPKGILVIGRTNQLDNRDKRNTFETYRRNLYNPEIITFDELLERAKYISNNTDDTQTKENWRVS